MHPDLAKLIDLQEADREIARLRAEIAALPKKVAEIEQKLATSKERAEAARAALKADEAGRRRHEGDIQALQQKISKYRDQMLSVKTNQEYKALTDEVEYAQRQIQQLEDKILELMLDTDTRQGALQQAESDLKAHTAEIEKEKTEVRARTAEDERTLAEWQEKRKHLRGAIDPDTLRHYDRVLKFRGSAIAEAQNHKCSGCQVMLRPQVYNDVRSNEKIIMCDSCHRILYYDPAHDSEVAADRSRPLAAQQADISQ